MNECDAVELRDGTVLLSMRSYRGTGQRAFALSKDGGLSWGAPAHDRKVYCPVCQSSIERYSLAISGGRDRLLYSGPAGPNRMNLAVRASYDDGQTWPIAKLLHDGPAAYSSLATLPDGTIACLYEGGSKSPYETINFARFTLDWLTDGKDAAAGKSN
jgi:sialidase-1